MSYQQCTVAGVCTCAVEVHTPGLIVRFDRCRRVGATGAPEDITVSMLGAGTQGALAVYRHQDLHTYYVSLASACSSLLFLSFSWFNMG